MCCEELFEVFRLIGLRAPCFGNSLSLTIIWIHAIFPLTGVMSWFTVVLEFEDGLVIINVDTDGIRIALILFIEAAGTSSCLW